MHKPVRERSAGNGRAAPLPPLERPSQQPAQNTSASQPASTAAEAQQASITSLHQKGPSRIPVLKSRTTSAQRLRTLSREIPTIVEESRETTALTAEGPTAAKSFPVNEEGGEDILSFMEKMKSPVTGVRATYSSNTSGARGTSTTSSDQHKQQFGRSPVSTVDDVGPLLSVSARSPFSQLLGTARVDALPSRSTDFAELSAPSLAPMEQEVSGASLTHSSPARSTRISRSPLTTPQRSTAGPGTTARASVRPKENPEMSFRSPTKLRFSEFVIDPASTEVSFADQRLPEPGFPQLHERGTPSRGNSSFSHQSYHGSRNYSGDRSHQETGQTLHGNNLQQTSNHGTDAVVGVDVDPSMLSSREFELTPGKLQQLREVLAARFGIDLDSLADEEGLDEEDEVSGSYFPLTDAEQNLLWSDIVKGNIGQGYPIAQQTRNWLRQSLRRSQLMRQSSLGDSLEASMAAPRPVLDITSETTSALQHPVMDRSDSAGSVSDRPPTPSSALQSVRASTHMRSPQGLVLDESVAALDFDASTASAVALPVTSVENTAVTQMPSGTTLRIIVKSTWGDQNYVGLTGIEMFDAQGRLIPATQVDFLDAEPRGVCVLPGQEGDVRTCDKLLDGHNITCDDTHMWLAPWNPKSLAVILLQFKQVTTLSMLRLYNYNKDRIHSFRGVRSASIFVDSEVIFEGEIRRAPGTIPDTLRESMAAGAAAPSALALNACESVYFTRDNAVLASIAAEDPLESMFADLLNQDKVIAATKDSAALFQETRRPQTAESAAQHPAHHDVIEEEEEDTEFDVDALLHELGGQPVGTVATPARPSVNPSDALPDASQFGSPRGLDESRTGRSDHISLASLPFGQRICVTLLASHGDQSYVGLTGVKLYIADPVSRTHGSISECKLSMANVSACPADINVDGHSGDVRTLDKLIDGHCVTDDDDHMWLVPLGASSPTLFIDLGRRCHLAAVRLYNYNQAGDANQRGARLIRIRVDGCPVINPRISAATQQPYDIFSLSRGPGAPWYDFGQYFPFTAVQENGAVRYYVHDKDRVSLFPRMGQVPPSALMQDTEPPSLPVGHTLKFVIFDSCGDPFYVGLDALALYDADGRRIPVRREMMHVLAVKLGEDGGEMPDLRQPANLCFDRTPTTHITSNAECAQREDDPRLYKAGGMPHDSTWLSVKMSPGAGFVSKPAVLMVINFPLPVCLSFIRFVNYSKTPIRGVGAVEIWLDDVSIYSGEVRPNAGGGASAVHQSSVVLFRRDKAFMDSVLGSSKQSYCGQVEQDVLCFNEGVLATHVSSKRAVERAAAVNKLYQASAKAGHQQLVRPQTAIVADERASSRASVRG